MISLMPDLLELTRVGLVEAFGIPDHNAIVLGALDVLKHLVQKIPRLKSMRKRLMLTFVDDPLQSTPAPNCTLAGAY
jgi:hypothetical protein